MRSEVQPTPVDHLSAPSGSQIPRSLLFAILGLGIAWRLLRYLLQFPVWGDEAMLCLNFLDHDYVQVTRHLAHGQVAPLLFLWGELTAVRWLGTSELAIRLLPLLAGLGAVLLFARLARSILSPLAATAAIGILAVSLWPVSMCTQAKPYSFDLFCSLLILVPAVECLSRPGSIRPLVWLTVLVVPALLGSYPAAFVAGGASLALAPAVFRLRRQRRLLLAYATFNVTVLLTFVVHYGLVGINQLQSQARINLTGEDMRVFWADAFPPASLVPLVKWLAWNHIGQMFSYPIGSAGGGSIATVILVVLGAIALRGRRPLLTLLLAPFALGLMAAALRGYPYGVPRLSQHLVPAIALLAGAGFAVVVERTRAEHRRHRLVVGFLAFLILLGLGGMIRDIARPARDTGVAWMRQMMADVSVLTGDRPIVILNSPKQLDSVFLWYLQTEHKHLIWKRNVDLDALDTDDVWCFHYSGPPQLCPHRKWSITTCDWKRVEQFPYSFVMIPKAHFPYTVLPTQEINLVSRCMLSHWQRIRPSAD